MNRTIALEDLAQALACVEYRLPKEHLAQPEIFAHTLGLRYGLALTAAASHVLSEEGSSLDEASDLLNLWVQATFNHSREMFSKDRTGDIPWVLHRMSHRVAFHVAREALTMQSYGFSLPFALGYARTLFETTYKRPMLRATPILLRGYIMREIRVTNSKSIEYARNFISRREFGLEEVREIALIGE